MRRLAPSLRTLTPNWATRHSWRMQEVRTPAASADPATLSPGGPSCSAPVHRHSKQDCMHVTLPAVLLLTSHASGGLVTPPATLKPPNFSQHACRFQHAAAAPPLTYLPGSQVPRCVADAVHSHLLHDCAQLGAGYPTSNRYAGIRLQHCCSQSGMWEATAMHRIPK